MQDTKMMKKKKLSELEFKKIGTVENYLSIKMREYCNMIWTNN